MADTHSIVMRCSKADTEAKNLDGKTALEVATLNSQDGVVELLKAAGEKKPEESS